jgi:type IV secretory pathway VirJ component
LRVNRVTALIVAGLLFGACVVVRAAPADSLPLVRVPAAPGGDGGPMVLLLSGDGDWAAFDRDLASAIVAQGSPVLGLESRTYFSTARTPGETAVALERAVRAQLAEWRRESLVIIGYSRGADVAPFVLNRWPADLRALVRVAVLISASERASFVFHLEDLVRDVARPTDLATRPEVEKLHDISLVCVQGEDEPASFCEHPVPGMRVLMHPGGHRVPSDAGTIALIVRELGLTK